MVTLTQLSGQPVPTPEPIYNNLRNAILTLSPADHGIAPIAGDSGVWGVLMEMGFPNAAVTLVSLADGTTSLYFGTGGGIIGGGQHAEVAEASLALVKAASRAARQLPAASSFPLPSIGEVKFYVLKADGVAAASEREITLETEAHPLAELYAAGQAVITQLRLMPPPPTN